MQPARSALADLIGAQAQGELSRVYMHASNMPSVHVAHAVTGMSVAPCGLRSNAMAKPLSDDACKAACNTAWHASVGNADVVSQSQLSSTDMCGGVQATKGTATAQAVKPGGVLVGSVPCALVEPGKTDARTKSIKSVRHAASQPAVQFCDLRSHTAAADGDVTHAATGMKIDVKNGHKGSKHASSKLVNAKNSSRSLDAKNSSGR